MDELIGWRFLIFATVFAAAIYAHFYLAHRQWKAIKGEQATDIDVNYVRSETYLPQSFRMKVKNWINVPAAEDRNGEIVIQKGLEKIRIARSRELPSESDCDEILVLEHNFQCGPGSRLRREVLVHGDCEIGADSHIQALAVDGELTLGARVRVARWADSGGDLRVGDEAQVAYRVTSQRRIWLGLNTEVASAHAPEVVTSGWEPGSQADPAPGLTLLEIVFPEDTKAAKTLMAANLKPQRFRRLGADTWLYQGDVALPIPVRVIKKLVLDGDCHFPAGSMIEADIKASGSISLGPGCTSRGNLVADGHIFLGRGCRFSGLIRAGKTILLSQGARGFRADGMVAVYAAQRLSLELDVAVKGKIASADRVTVVSAASSEVWKKRHGIREDGSRLERV